MLNEPASTLSDRQPVRTSHPAWFRKQDAADTLRDELRDMVATVLQIEVETFGDVDANTSDPSLTHLNLPHHLIASFEGRLLFDSEEAYERLDKLLTSYNYLPLFREVTIEAGPGETRKRHIIHIVAGRIQMKPRAWWPNLVLFIATFLSVLWVGAEIAISNEIGPTNPALAQRLANNFLLELWRGLPYAISLMLILGAHELGHYFMARRHKVAVTLPYFIPLPFISPIGTLGAAILQREPIRNRKILFDVGVAGPLAGVIFAIPVLLIGLATAYVGPIVEGGTVEGNSVLYALAKIVTFGHFLPDGKVDVYVNQLAWAGWTGLLVTALNLMPLGQLDGGHIIYAMVGERARWLYYPLMLLMGALLLLNPTWLIWILLLFLFGRVYAAPLDMITPLDSSRRLVGVLALVIFLLTFVPIPFSESPGPSNLQTSSMLVALLVGVLLRLRR